MECSDQETVECSLCGESTTEYCSTLACRKCHKTISFDDCVSGQDIGLGPGVGVRDGAERD